MEIINSFSGKYFFLSNFYQYEDPHLADVLWGYASMEHYYQAMKCADHTSRAMFKRPGLRAGQAKRLGRIVELRPDWEQIKDEVMLTGLRIKFDIDREDGRLAQMLVDTGDAILIEGNHWHDNYWGVCYCPKCKDNGGDNRLGHLLMQVRSELREE